MQPIEHQMSPSSCGYRSKRERVCDGGAEANAYWASRGAAGAGLVLGVVGGAPASSP